MTPIEQLRQAAEQRRDALIKQARGEYRKTVRELKAMSERLDKPVPKKPRLEPTGDFSTMTVREATETVLRKAGKPMLLTELTDSRSCGGAAGLTSALGRVSNAVRMTLLYHAKQGRFFYRREGRWARNAQVTPTTLSSLAFFRRLLSRMLKKMPEAIKVTGRIEASTRTSTGPTCRSVRGERFGHARQGIAMQKRSLPRIA